MAKQCETHWPAASFGESQLESCRDASGPLVATLMGVLTNNLHVTSVATIRHFVVAVAVATVVVAAT